MTAAIQNIQVLIRYAKGPHRMAMTGTMVDMIKTRASSFLDFFLIVKSELFPIKIANRRISGYSFSLGVIV